MQSCIATTFVFRRHVQVALTVKSVIVVTPCVENNQKMFVYQGGL